MPVLMKTLWSMRGGMAWLSESATPAWLAFICLILAATSGSVSGQSDYCSDKTMCKSGYGYPTCCPRPGDLSNHTRCCKYYLQAACCEERANHVCAISPDSASKRSTNNWDPPLSWRAIFCPQPGQPDSFTACSWSRGRVDCYDVNKLAAILGGVFGGLLLIAIIVIVVMVVLYKKGYFKCVKVGNHGNRHVMVRTSQVEREKY